MYVGFGVRVSGGGVGVAGGTGKEGVSTGSPSEEVRRADPLPKGRRAHAVPARRVPLSREPPQRVTHHDEKQEIAVGPFGRRLDGHPQTIGAPKRLQPGSFRGWGEAGGGA